jgi:hypothetical protein
VISHYPSNGDCLGSTRRRESDAIEVVVSDPFHPNADACILTMKQFLYLLFCFIAFAIGCDTNANVPSSIAMPKGIVPCTLQVTMDGQPLKLASVRLIKEGEPLQPYGTVINGSAAIYTGGEKGAPNGVYKVLLDAFTDGVPPEVKPPIQKIPGKFTKAETTPLSIDSSKGSTLQLNVSSKH